MMLKSWKSSAWDAYFNISIRSSSEGHASTVIYCRKRPTHSSRARHLLNSPPPEQSHGQRFSTCHINLLVILHIVMGKRKSETRTAVQSLCPNLTLAPFTGARGRLYRLIWTFPPDLRHLFSTATCATSYSDFFDSLERLRVEKHNFPHEKKITQL
jgi:hypothetical protein